MKRHNYSPWLFILFAITVGVQQGCGSAVADKNSAATPATVKPATGDWTIFRGNPAQTGVAVAELPDQLDILWQFKAKDGFEGTAAIVGDTVFAGCLDENLYAFELATGKEKWKYKAGPIKAPVSFKDGLIYVGDLDGKFHCVDAVTGQKRWIFETEAEISSGANFAGDAILFGSGDENLYCITTEGKLKWKFKVPGGPVLGSPAVGGDRTFATGCDSTLHIIDIADGKEQSSVALDSQTGASAALAGDQLFIGTMNNQVLAIDWKKSEVSWKFESTKNPQPYYSSAAVTGDLVILGSRDKHLYALDRKTGKEMWSYPTKGKVDSSPVVAGKRLYFGSHDGHLYILDVAKGTEVRTIPLKSPVLGSPALAKGRLVIGTQDGHLYCLGAKKP